MKAFYHTGFKTWYFSDDGGLSWYACDLVRTYDPPMKSTISLKALRYALRSRKIIWIL